MYKIFVVEDDEIIALTVKKHLEGWGYEVACASSFKDILHEFAEFEPHLVFMDINLPVHNGYYWCGEIRKISKVPIVFISSASDNMNIVMAMNMGGDDFITKPFDIDVLVAKVQAMLRRSYDFQGQTNILEHKGAILDLSEASVIYNGKKASLTKNEFKILQVLMENNSNIVSRSYLMEKLWESDSYVDENTLSVNVNRLRKTLENIGLQDFIITKKGIGYKTA
ncbi:MAG: response regulator transcription factor [Lachnospiraceae bacterium]|nr:response regulator transcription factor [Lachnospiraceae bacterium]